MAINAEPRQNSGVTLGVDGGFGEQNRLAALFVVVGGLEKRG